MLSRLLISSALLAAALFNTVHANPIASVGQVRNADFTQGYPSPSNPNILLPLYWEQSGSGNDTHPTVSLSRDHYHSAPYSALFMPKSITNLKGVNQYVAEIYQDINLFERGQLLTMTWWFFPGEVPPGVDYSPIGGYNFTVSYDHDHDSHPIEAIYVPGTGSVSDNNFYQFTASWNAPIAHNHVGSYITLSFTTTQTNVQVYLDDITLTAPLIVGDPQFVGLRGQSYQVHGIDGAVYNLVSSPSTQVNAQFKFLAAGECPVFDGIADSNCWAHPGSYLGSVGVQEIVEDRVHRVTIVAGSAKNGFASIWIDGQEMTIGKKFDDTDAFSVELVSSHRVIVQTSQFLFTFDNSDLFINQAVASRVPLSLLRSHGLFGQTHQRKTYLTALKYIAGDVDDYVIEEGTLFGKLFVYNQFQQE